MLGFVETIFAILGLVGIYSSNQILMIIGLIAIVICDFIDIFIIGHNSVTIFIAVLLAIGMSFGTRNPLYSFCFALCWENFIITIIMVIIMIYGFISAKRGNKNEKV